MPSLLDYLAFLPPIEFDAAVPSLSAIPDSQKQVLVRDAFDAIHSYLDWSGTSLLETKYKDQLDGLGGETVWVPSCPMTSIQGVWIDTERRFNVTPPALTDTNFLVPATEYRIDHSKWGILRSRTFQSNLALGAYGFARRGGATGQLYAGETGWPQGKGVVWAEYTGGYTATTVPSVLKSVAAQLIAYDYKFLRSGGVVATSGTYQDVTEGFTVVAAAFKNDGVFMNARSMLNRAGLVRPRSYAIAQ